MRKSVVDRRSQNRFLLISNIIGIPDINLLAIKSKRRDYRVDADPSENIREYWKITGGHLRKAMREIESQIDSAKELSNG